ncbi:MAG: hypothetical protein OEV21_04110 [Thermoplasmata archaeon]|nr:hypothetical protein [Thermoplasmata archaeon]
MEENNSGAIGGRKWNFARRFVHVLLSIGVLYYWLPDPLMPGFPKWFLLVIGLAIIAFIEILRFGMKIKLPWTRPYEEGRLAGHTYSAVGAVIVFLIAPMEIGTPAIIAMAWADPIAGEVRKRTGRREIGWLACGISYAIIAGIVVFLIVPWRDVGSMGLLVAIMTITAVFSEEIGQKYLDDDFTMLVLPTAVAMIYWVILLDRLLIVTP